MHSTQVLTAEEVIKVIKGLTRRAKRSARAKLNLTIFRLSAGCGLRVSEICGLNLGDVVCSGTRPVIRVRKEITKGKKRARLVPLWWDSGTCADIAAWKARRVEAGAQPGDPLLLSTKGVRFCRQRLYSRWRNILKQLLSPERASQVSIHGGRHTFCSHALSVGRSLAEVRDAAGHRNITTSSIYLHTLEKDGVPDLYGPRPGLIRLAAESVEQMIEVCRSWLKEHEITCPRE